MKTLSCLLVFFRTVIAPSNPKAAQEPGDVETKVKTLFIDPQSQTPIIILETETVVTKRILPIWINIAEARAIALELEHVTLPRPLTLDPIRNMLQGHGRNSAAGIDHRAA